MIAYYRLFNPAKDLKKTLDIREADRKEIALLEPTVTPEQALINSLYRSYPNAYTMIVDDEIIGYFGVAPHPEQKDVGLVWLLASERFKSVYRTVLKNAERVLDKELFTLYPILMNCVSRLNKDSIKFLSWLGFSFIETKNPDVLLFWKTKQ